MAMVSQLRDWFDRTLRWDVPHDGLPFTIESYGNSLRALALGPTYDDVSATNTGEILARIDEAIAQGPTGLAELTAIEARLYQALPDRDLLRRLWMVRDRFERIAASGARAAYAASDPPHPAPPPNAGTGGMPKPPPSPPDAQVDDVK